MPLMRTIPLLAASLLALSLLAGCRGGTEAENPDSSVTVVKTDDEPTPAPAPPPTIVPAPDNDQTTVVTGNQNPPPEQNINVNVKSNPQAKQAPAPQQPDPKAAQREAQKQAQKKQAAGKTDPAVIPVPQKKAEAIRKKASSGNAPKSPPAVRQTDRPAAKSKGKTAPAAGAPLVVEVEVETPSKVPDPSSVPYKDALTFVRYRVVSVERGQYAPKEILAVHWGMKDGKLAPAAQYKEGDRLTLTLEPFSKHPELSRVMQADDTNEFELEPYWAVAAQR